MQNAKFSLKLLDTFQDYTKLSYSKEKFVGVAKFPKTCFLKMGHVACRTRYAIKQSLHSWQQVWHTNFLCSQPNETLTEKRFRKNSFYYTVVEKERCCLPFVPPALPPA